MPGNTPVVIDIDGRHHEDDHTTEDILDRSDNHINTDDHDTSNKHIFIDDVDDDVDDVDDGADTTSLMDVHSDYPDEEDDDTEADDDDDYSEVDMEDDIEDEEGDEEEEEEEEHYEAPQIFYQSMDAAPDNKIFALNAKFKVDRNPSKMNLGIGAFRDDNGDPVILSVVKAVESEIVNDLNMGLINHEYPPIGGSQLLVRATIRLIFGEHTKLIKSGRATGIQALSGTGSLKVVGDFLREHHTTIHIPNPTWANHKNIFEGCNMTVKQYTYYDDSGCSLDMDGLVRDLRKVPENDVVLFHACAHNPTGVDPTKNQWKQIAQICKERKVQVVFDSAYLGFASGDIDADAWAMRYFRKEGIDFFVCLSYSKNMGLYSERCGAVVYHSKSRDIASSVCSHLKLISRRLWSVPPQHGSRIVERILSHKARSVEWRSEVKVMAERILNLRKELYEELVRVVGGDWTHVIKQKGMFTYSGLNTSQCEDLVNHHSIYLLDTGRISISGIPKGGVPLLVSKIKLVVDAYAPAPPKQLLTTITIDGDHMQTDTSSATDAVVAEDDKPEREVDGAKVEEAVELVQPLATVEATMASDATLSVSDLAPKDQLPSPVTAAS